MNEVDVSEQDLLERHPDVLRALLKDHTRTAYEVENAEKEGRKPAKDQWNIIWGTNAYIKTRFFRYMVSIKKKTQHAFAAVYQFVPLQGFSKPWTDEELYKKYKLTKPEIDFIELMIKPME